MRSDDVRRILFTDLLATHDPSEEHNILFPDNGNCKIQGEHIIPTQNFKCL